MADAPVRITPRGPLDIAQIAAFGDVTAIAARLSKHFGRTITAIPNRAVAGGDLTVLWHGPGQWLIVRAPAATPLMDDLARVCEEDAALVGLGHARTALRVEGEGARDLLANGTSIDLRPAHFAPGTCALTAMGKIGALLHAVAPDTIDVYVARSYGQAVVEWLKTAGESVGTAPQ